MFPANFADDRRNIISANLRHLREKIFGKRKTIST